MKVFTVTRKFPGQDCFCNGPRFFYCLLLLISLTAPARLFSQTSPLSFTRIPYSDPDLICPGRGAEQWDNGNDKVNNPVADTNHKSMDVYYRFPWTSLEGDSLGSYDWTHFDNLIKDAIDHRQKISFGIMPVHDGEGAVTYDGAKSAYPYYVHKLMQGAGSATSRDWISNGVWIPNWNSPYYLGRLKALHTALNAHILNSGYNGVLFKNAIYCIDIRGYGNYGEWHNAGIVDHISDYPLGRRATITTLKAIINAHTTVFKSWPLTIMVAAFDADQYDAIMNPAEVTYYALTTSNAWGPLGWRRDQWGANDSYLDNILKNNEKTFGTSPPFKELITSRFLTSPITGEPPGGYDNSVSNCEYWNLESQLTDYGATSLGNGNWGITLSECGKNNARAAFKKTGYRLVLEDGSITNPIYAGKSLNITLNWKNLGIAPTYENWNAVFELKNNNNVTIWSGTSKFKPKRFAPSPLATTIIDSFILSANIPVGNYKLNLIIKDPSGYRAPLPMAITGRNTDGSYTLKTITVSPVNCLPPTAKISNLSNCNGQASLVLDSASGSAPYDLVIDGTTYNDVAIGQEITTLTIPSQKIWQSNPAPSANEDSPLELGVKFKSATAGFIKGIRFFSSTNQSGTYSGHLWTADGTLLESAQFINVTPGGWQEVSFTTPVRVEADKVYVASYHTASGRYAATSGGLTSTVTNGSLTALANGVYNYGTSSFPSNSSYNGNNYWVDVMFVPDTYTFNLTSVTDNMGCNNSGILQQLAVSSANNCNSLPTATISHSSFCRGEEFNLVLSSATGAGPYDITINDVTYNDVAIGETITTVKPPAQKIWQTNPLSTSNEDSPVELGLKFKSSVAGLVNGVRFFSPNNPSGIYTGNLWSREGTLLSSATFINVNASEWQEVLFATPIQIEADSIYIVSYHTAGGRYSATSGSLTTAFTNGTLTALGNESSGGNGLYRYGASGFPNNTSNGTNYWVDVLFTTNNAYSYTFNLTSVKDNTGLTKTGSLQTLSVASTECSQLRTAPSNNEKTTISQNSLSPVNGPKTPAEDKKLNSLQQNYPNPFNSMTTISYSLANPAKVNLSLFDMNGRLVRVLVNNAKDAGIHTLRFNSGTLSSGIYYYKIQTGSFSDVKKMIIH